MKAVVSEPLDLGHDHTIQLVTPEGDPTPSGADVAHLTPAGEPCVGWIPLDVPRNERLAVKWQVESWEPLTLSPSLLCGCGDHGWVRSGAWQPA